MHILYMRLHDGVDAWMGANDIFTPINSQSY